MMKSPFSSLPTAPTASVFRPSLAQSIAVPPAVAWAEVSDLDHYAEVADIGAIEREQSLVGDLGDRHLEAEHLVGALLEVQPQDLGDVFGIVLRVAVIEVK